MTQKKRDEFLTQSQCITTKRCIFESTYHAYQAHTILGTRFRTITAPNAKLVSKFVETYTHHGMNDPSLPRKWLVPRSFRQNLHNNVIIVWGNAYVCVALVTCTSRFQRLYKSAIEYTNDRILSTHNNIRTSSGFHASCAVLPYVFVSSISHFLIRVDTEEYECIRYRRPIIYAAA